MSQPDKPLEKLKHPRVREAYRDEALWALDKPAGVLSHPNPPRRRDRNAVLDGIYNLKEESYQFAGSHGEERRIYLVHRLDRDTSGLILCAFQQEVASRLKEDLRQGRVSKEYRALTLGAPRPKKGRWEDCLVRSAETSRIAVRTRRGKPNSRANYEVLKVFQKYQLTLLALRPQTGRTHQLRVQAATRGFPVAGDTRYGDFRRNRVLIKEIGLERMFLHAHRLSFRHPLQDQPLELEAPLPEELEGVLRRLED